MANLQKQETVTEILNTLQGSENIALIKFEKTTHISLEGLRKDLKKNKAKLSVIKNTLLEKAVNKLATEKETLKDFGTKAFPLKETTGLLTFDTDWSSALKAFSEYAKKDSTLSFKAGILDGNVYLTEELKRIATLPSKAELVAKVIGSMKSPSTKLVYSMKFNLQKLVFVLAEKSRQTA